MQPEKVKPPQLLVEEDDLFSAAAAGNVSRYVLLCRVTAKRVDFWEFLEHDFYEPDVLYVTEPTLLEH